MGFDWGSGGDRLIVALANGCCTECILHLHKALTPSCQLASHPVYDDPFYQIELLGLESQMLPR